MKSIKSVILTVLLVVASVSISSAQLVLSDFSDFANDADNLTGDGFFFSGANWDTTITQGSGVATASGSDVFGDMSWWFNLETADLSSYTVLNLTANITSSNSLAGLEVNFLNANFDTVLATQFFTLAELNGSEVSKSIVLPVDVGGFQIKAVGLATSTFSGSIDNLSISAIPEPSTYALIALGIGALVVLRRKNAAKQA